MPGIWSLSHRYPFQRTEKNRINSIVLNNKNNKSFDPWKRKQPAVAHSFRTMLLCTWRHHQISPMLWGRALKTETILKVWLSASVSQHGSCHHPGRKACFNGFPGYGSYTPLALGFRTACPHSLTMAQVHIQACILTESPSFLTTKISLSSYTASISRFLRKAWAFSAESKLLSLHYRQRIGPRWGWAGVGP